MHDTYLTLLFSPCSVMRAHSTRTWEAPKRVRYTLWNSKLRQIIFTTGSASPWQCRTGTLCSPSVSLNIDAPVEGWECTTGI